MISSLSKPCLVRHLLLVFLTVLTVCLYFIACGPAPAQNKKSSISNNGDSQKYVKQSYATAAVDMRPFGLTNCQNAIQVEKGLVMAACRRADLDSPSDNGLRLFLINLDQQKILYHSKGVADSYYMKFSIYGKDQSKQSRFVFAEIGAEYSYGVKVFMLSDQNVKYIGSIDETVNIDESPSSVVPFITIQDKKNKTEFGFARDVLALKSNGEYATVLKNKLKYTYSTESGFVRRVQ